MNRSLTADTLNTLAVERQSMADSTLDDVRRALDRATELQDDEALSVLRTAREDLKALGNDADVDEERRRELVDRVDQRIREVENRDDYDSGLGAAMNPDEDEAP